MKYIFTMVRRCLLVIALGANLFWWPQLSKGQNTSTEAAKKQTNGTKQPVPPVPVIIEEPVPTIRTQPVSTEDRADSKEKPLPQFERPEWVIVYITAAYVLIAWWTLKAIKRQADTMDKQVTDAQKSAAEATAISKQAADAAKASADALVGIDRAWLVFVFEPTQDPAIARFHIQNVGNTPAWVTEVAYFYRRNGQPISSVSISFTPRVLRWEAGSVLPSKESSKAQDVILDDGRPLTESEKSAAREGSLFLILGVFLRYDDFLGNRRETCICQKFVPGTGWVDHGPRELNRRT